MYKNGFINKIIFFFVIFFVGVSCNKTPEYIQLVQKITALCSKELEKKYNLRLESCGGRLMYDVEQVAAGYVAAEPFTIERARRIYIGISQCYLDEINANTNIRQFLHNYPFDFSNLDICLSVSPCAITEYCKEQLDFCGNKVFFVSSPKENKILYRTYDYSKGTYELIWEETYEEALELFKLDKQDQHDQLFA